MKKLNNWLLLIMLSALIYGCFPPSEDILPLSSNGNQTELMNFLVDQDQLYVFNRKRVKHYHIQNNAPVLRDQFQEIGYMDYGYLQDNQLIAGDLYRAIIYDKASDGMLLQVNEVELDDCHYAENQVFNSNFDEIHYWDEYVLVGRKAENADLSRSRCQSDSLFLFRKNENGLNRYLDAVSLSAQGIIHRGNGRFAILSPRAILEYSIENDQLIPGDTVAYQGGTYISQEDSYWMVLRNRSIHFYHQDSLRQSSAVWSYGL